MEQTEREKYLRAYYDNEADANRQMSFANAFGGLLMITIWILYLLKVFDLHGGMIIAVNIAFPINILILFTPLLFAFKFKDSLRKPTYKYFVIFSFVFVIAVLNTIIPKHALLGWAICIVITNHYYNPKVGLVTFLVVISVMLFCIYLSMFVGEYDSNILGVWVIQDGEIIYPEGIKERFEMLQDMLAHGENRYLKAFVFYYLPRGAFLTMIFIVSNSLNKRTYKLLVSEIQVSGDQQKTKTELGVAKDIQLATLPVEFISNEDVEIQAELRAAKTVGGDFYDYYVLSKSHIAILIGDVSGKGIPAAMFMMKVITCFKNYMSIDRTPAEIMKLVNKAIYEGNDSAMFVTCFLAILNTETGELKFANAGHNPPIVGQKGNYQFLNCRSGFILGAMKDALVVDETINLNNGDTITLYTDGITEAMNENREQYGNNRLLELFNRKEYSCLVELHHELKENIENFVGNEEQSDDMTYITLKYHGEKYNYKEKIFPGKQEHIPEMLEFLKDFAKAQKFDESLVNNIAVVGDELISNIIKYGYKDYEGEIFLRLLYNLDKKEYILTIIDTGIEFNPFEYESVPITEDNYESRPEGGLGILIVKKMMSQYAYDHINDKNITILKKKF